MKPVLKMLRRGQIETLKGLCGHCSPVYAHPVEVFVPDGYSLVDAVKTGKDFVCLVCGSNYILVTLLRDSWKLYKELCHHHSEEEVLRDE